MQGVRHLCKRHRCCPHAQTEARSVQQVGVALTGVIGAIRVLLVSCHLLGLIFRVAHTDKVTVGDSLEAVASGAHLRVHLVPTADRGCIVRLHDTIVRPRIWCGVEDITICARRLGGENKRRTAGGASGRKPAQ